MGGRQVAWKAADFFPYLANLLVDVVQPRDLDQPPDVVVRQPIREEPTCELIPLAQSPPVDAQSEFGSINEESLQCQSALFGLKRDRLTT